MLQVSAVETICVFIEPVDFRKRIEGLCGICRRSEMDPLSGHLFVFRNKNQTMLRVMGYDSTGFWLFEKQLTKGRFPWWPAGEEVWNSLAAKELLVLLWGGNPDQARFVDEWKKIDSLSMG
jgi:transposase